jgi:hypothetical protein
MALTHGFSWVVGANGEAYRAIGRPDYETKIMAATLLFYVPAYWLSIQQGFTAFLWTRLATTLGGVAIHYWVAHLALAFPLTRTSLNLAKVSVIGIPLIMIERNLALLGETPIAQLTVGTIAAAGWMGAYLWLTERKSLIPEVRNMLKRRTL